MKSKFLPYIKIARPDHWVKQIFIFPGIILAALATKITITDLILPVLLCLVSTSLLASANYTINEWLDREFDKFHPKKKDRVSVRNLVNAKYVYLQYIFLVIVGLGLSSLVSLEYFSISCLLIIMGIIYNVSPLRTKDRQYLDVLSESINNPIRLLLGWFVVTNIILPPSTIIVAYWMGGAFLMAIKRYAEYVAIDDKSTAGLYRRSFRFYTRENLIISAFFYALCAVFFLAVFMYKYKIELVVSFPFISLLFVWYLYFAVSPNSIMQNPEGLYAERRFVLYIIFLCALISMLTLVDIPFLEVLTNHSF